MTGLSVKRFRNSNEDESLFVPVGIAFESIPQNYRELIDDSHRGFLRDPVGVLTALSERTSFETLSSWLKHLAESERFGLIVHYAEFCGNIQHEFTICCSSLCRQRFFRLPTANIPDGLPKPLYDFYSATDGITESVDAFNHLNNNICKSLLKIIFISFKNSMEVFYEISNLTTTIYRME